MVSAAAHVWVLLITLACTVAGHEFDLVEVVDGDLRNGLCRTAGGGSGIYTR